MQLFTILLANAPIEDVYVYRTSLYCWTFDNRLRVYSVDDLESAIAALNPERSAFVSYALFHSRGLGASIEQQRAWHDRWESFQEGELDDSPIVIDGEAVPYAEASVQLEGDALLDVHMYYDRLYLATNGGLYAVEPFEPSDLVRGRLGAEQKVQDPCYSATAGLGTIAASCGPKGLRLVLDDFRWTSREGMVRKASDESMRAEIGYGSVVNHRSRSDYEFLATTVEDTNKGPVLIDTRRADTARSDDVNEFFDVSDQSIDFTFWDRSRLLVFGSGSALSISVVTSGDQRRLNRARTVGSYRGIPGPVISAARLGQVFALESERSVSFVRDGSLKTFDTGRVVSLRTYPKSYRYQRLATVASSRGLWMFGLEQ